MRPLTSRTLLDAWETGQHQSWPQRALTLLAASDPDTPIQDWAGLTVGERDRRLMLLRQWAFGPTASALVACGACGQRLEFPVDLDRLGADCVAAEVGAMAVRMDGWDVQFRLPNGHDLSAVAAHADLAAARDLLLARCVLAATAEDTTIAVDAMPVAVQSAVIDMMASADPLADVRLAVRCPGCEHQWDCAFDILRFFWTEIHAWASRLLREVHQLATAYGWRESEILSMTPWRRAAYLELVDPWRTS